MIDNIMIMIIVDQKILELAKYEAEIYFYKKVSSEKEKQDYIIKKYIELGGVMQKKK